MKQLELVLEQPKEFVDLLESIKIKKLELETYVELSEKVVKLYRSDIHKKQEQLALVCIHPESYIKTREDYDYHNNVSWEVKSCGSCGKRISRV